MRIQESGGARREQRGRWTGCIDSKLRIPPEGSGMSWGVWTLWLLDGFSGPPKCLKTSDYTLERWLSGKGHSLLLKRTRVWFPAPT